MRIRVKVSLGLQLVKSYGELADSYPAKHGPKALHVVFVSQAILACPFYTELEDPLCNWTQITATHTHRYFTNLSVAGEPILA